MSTPINDLKYALRMMCKHPGFTAIALVTLAIGIGSNTIMFSMVNVLLLRPVQVDRFDELAACQAENADWHFPYEAYVALRENNPVFTEVAAVSGMQPPVTWAPDNHMGQARRALVNCVSANYFSCLGTAPAYGRWFLPEEERYGAEPVVVLSYAAWQRSGADPRMVGSQILLNARLFRVVGVAPRGFTGTSLAGPDLWTPLGCFGVLASAHRSASSKGRQYCAAIPIGRLKPGLSLAAAQAQLQAVAPDLRNNFPQWWNSPGVLRLSRPSRMSFFPLGVDGERLLFSALSLCLMAVSGLVLLIACLNLASMMIVQGTSRRREIAIRMAIGGGRLRIIQQLLCECLLMSLAGGALGCVFAWAGTRVVNTWIDAAQFPVDLPPSFLVKLDGRVLLGTLGFCAVATLLFGLKPALRLSGRNVMADLKESGRDALRLSHQRGWMPRGLSVVGQTALSVVLVMGAALFTRSAVKAVHTHSDFDFSGKLIVEMDLQAAGYDAMQGRQICATMVDRFQAMPEVESVALSRSSHFGGSIPFSGPVYAYAPDAGQRTSGPKLAQNSVRFSVGTNYFKTMGLPLLQGRAFRELDCAADAEAVVVIDEQLANALRPGGNALGCLIQLGRQDENATAHRVVGIVPTLSSAAEDMRNVQAHVYTVMRVHERHLPAFIHVLARTKTARAEEALKQSLSQEIRRVDPRLPVVSMSTLKTLQQSDLFVWVTGLGARLALTFGAMALFLAALGIYAIKGHMVASRTPEIGIRKALGATRKDIMLMVFRQGGVLMLIGLGGGLAIGLGLARLMQNLFYNISPVDPVSIVMTIAVLALTSLVAGYIPARRAANVEPMEALRYE